MSEIDGVNCLIAGAGFCGSVIARKLAEAGKKVLLLERRNHIAGNMYDETDSNGILVHRYGPHIFHTYDKEVFDFISKYGSWMQYHHRCAVEIEGVNSPLPSNFRTIDLLYDKGEAETLKASLQNRFGGQKSVTIPELLDCEEITIRKYAERLYKGNYRPYTVKQWGIPPEEIDPSILKRVPVRLDYTDGYFDDKYQVMPQNGYTQFFKNLLDHENIKVLLNTDAADLLKTDINRKEILYKGMPIKIPIVYTGSIDELLNNMFGKLPYRSLTFEYQTKSADSFQDAPVVVYPEAKGYIRITEYKKLPPQNMQGITTIAYEYPVPAEETNMKEQYYPILTNDNMLLYEKYHSELSRFPNLFLCGRLADYKYYNMDTVIQRAFEISDKLVKDGNY